LLDSRYCTCKSRLSLTHHHTLIRKLDSQAMSGDKTDPDHPGPPKTFLIVRPVWQSRELTDFLHNLDTIYRANWKNPHRQDRCTRGNPPHIRVYHPSKSQTEKGHIPKGLPWNCYDAGWLMSL
ncbi:hypothetical protein V8E55_004604, partial [Tylopilus felleus]